MGRMVRTCLQSVLKLVNSVAAFVGVGLILYSLWMINVWFRQTHAFPTAGAWGIGLFFVEKIGARDFLNDRGYELALVLGSTSGLPVLLSMFMTYKKFIYTSFGLGVSLCLITCFGHIAAETANGHGLACYMALVFLLVMLEAAVTADVILNLDWEEDFPEDQTGRFNEFKNFIRSNDELCRWIGSVIVAAQAMSLFLGMILRALGPDSRNGCDSDDEYIPARLPLLRDRVQHAPYVGDPSAPYQKDSWNVR